jgi:hypothetical protein
MPHLNHSNSAPPNFPGHENLLCLWMGTNRGLNDAKLPNTTLPHFSSALESALLVNGNYKGSTTKYHPTQLLQRTRICFACDWERIGVWKTINITSPTFPGTRICFACELEWKGLWKPLNYETRIHRYVMWRHGSKGQYSLSVVAWEQLLARPWPALSQHKKLT